MPSAALLNLDSGSFDVMLSRGVRIMAYDAAMKTIMDEVAADLSWFVSHPCDLIQRLESCTTREGLNSRLSPYARRVVTFSRRYDLNLFYSPAFTPSHSRFGCRVATIGRVSQRLDTISMSDNRALSRPPRQPIVQVV
ncbi:protein of unknown function [Bradyrhizobium vignae]|uniref:Uncharacterized protein n=1 Tax=Bradyrhizobium vignae TaxID=1549949 RepID=A0A2U3PTY3_9BRAD|nr:protein of unknown function [Bradyrhizobium vignae]